jgi:H+/gluconate symporter-like permease
MNNQVISLISILISLVLLVILVIKGFNLYILAPLLAVIIILVSGMDLVTSLTTTYMTGFAGYVTRFYLIFLFGAVYGRFMKDSGAADSIAQGLLKITGTKSQMTVLAAIAFITAVLTFGGVSLFVAVFAIMPIARPLHKQLNIPWPLFTGAFFFGMGTFTMTMIPGTPQIQNIIPMSYLGTTLTAAPVVGLTGAAVVIAYDLWWLNHERKNYLKKGLGYEETKGKLEIGDELVGGVEKKIPPLLISLTPIIVLLLLLNIVKLNVVLSLAVIIIVSAVLFYKYLDSPLKTLNTGALSVASPILNTCAVVGFGAVIGASPGFALMKDALIGIPGHPLISWVVGINLLAGVTGSASGGLSIAMETLTPFYKGLANPEALHRLASIASGGLDALPHNGAVVTGLTVMGLTHKEGYKAIWNVAVVGPVLASVFAIIVAIMIYG